MVDGAHHVRGRSLELLGVIGVPGPVPWLRLDLARVVERLKRERVLLRCKGRCPGGEKVETPRASG